MSNTNENLKFAELAKKSNIPLSLVEVLLKDNYTSYNNALKLLSGIHSVKEKGISDDCYEILFNGDNFSCIKKVFELLDDNTLLYLPYITGNMATKLVYYWYDEKIRFDLLSKKSGVPINIVEIFITDTVSDEEAVEFLSKIRSVKEKGISDSDKKIFLYGEILGRKNQILHLLEDNKYFSHIYYDLNGDEIWELIKYLLSK